MLLRDDPHPKAKKRPSGGPNGNGRLAPTKRRVVKAPAPSRRQVRNAVAQGNAYVSQGKAVEKVANRQRAYKHSRPYYAKAVGEWEKSPGVAPIVKVLKREKKAGRFNSPAINSALKSYEKEARKGPDKLAKADYRRYTKGLWEKAKDDYPGSDKRPGYAVGYTGDATARVLNQHNKVHYNRQIPRNYMGGPGPARAYTKSLPLHEWAHTRQRHGLPEWVSEGSAEIKKDHEAKKLGLRKTGMGPQYAKYEKGVRRLRRRYGRKRVNRKIYR